MANFFIAEKPSCTLTQMNNNEKAYTWVCHDFSDPGDGQLSKLAARFQNVDAANDFKTKFEAAQVFNTDAKAGKTKEELVWAETVEDIDEPVEDDIDTNKTADADGE